MIEQDLIKHSQIYNVQCTLCTMYINQPTNFQIESHFEEGWWENLWIRKKCATHNAYTCWSDGIFYKKASTISTYSTVRTCSKCLLDFHSCLFVTYYINWATKGQFAHKNHFILLLSHRWYRQINTPFIQIYVVFRLSSALCRICVCLRCCCLS